ncbi:Stress response protein nst1 [Coemansia pectinata]|uniref:Stress response protein NST1 n=1 Tax=Coemansia pectinata TaxID=1052879 RepID=A0A9W8LBH7_9FUNG|nr:Stress response protein nst1 [Coemansia pectinata]
MDSSHLQPGPSNGKPSGTNSGEARWKLTPSMRAAAAAAATAAIATNVTSATQGSTSTAAPTVYGPEPPPSMARSKASAGGSDPISFDLKNISMLLNGERRGDMSRSECMRQTEAELQRLFHSRLVEIMATNGYDDGGFTELDVANVMVANGLMNAPSDDPLVALATELKSEMSSIFHSNMRRMSNNVIDPEFLAGIASDPFVIDSIIDLSWGRVRGGDSSDISAPFEGIANALRNFSLPECFNHPACGEDEDTDSNDEYEDDDAPEIPSTVSAQASLSDDDITAPANYPARAKRRARNRGKAEDKGKADAAPAQKVPPAPAPVPIPTAAPELESADTASPKATRGQRRRMRKSMYRAATEPNGSHATVSDPQPALGAPASGANSSAPLLPDNTASSGETLAEKLVQVGHIYGRSPEGLLSRFPMMGPPPPPGARPPSPGVKLEKILSVGPAQRMPVRISSAEGGSVIDVEPVHPTASAPPVATSVASTPAASTLSVDAPVASGSKRVIESTKTLWSSDAIEEQRRVREFWLSLGATERQSLIGAEKKVVQARVREHQNFSCSCNVCSRKRQAIESELDCLYDCYYDELKENVRKANMRSLIRAAEKKARFIIESSIGAFARSLISRAAIESQHCTKEVFCKNIIECLRAGKTVDIPPNCPEFESLNELESAVYTAAMSASNGVLTKIASVVRYLDKGSSCAKAIEDAGLLTKSSDKELATIKKAAIAIKEWTDGSSAYRQEFGTEPFHSDEEGDEDAINNNDLFYTENMLDSIDTFPTDGKKFFDMMEQLAEYRMRREDAFLDGLVESEAGDDDGPAHESSGTATHAWSRKSRRQSRSQRRCPDCQGEIGEGEGEERQNYSDPEYNVARYAGTKRPRSESRGGDRGFTANSAKVQFDNISIEYVNHPDDLSKGKAGYSGGLDPSYDDEEDDDDGYEDEDEDDEDEDDDDDLEDDDDDTDDDYDDLDPENAEKDAEEGRKVFQLFAARLFEQRVINLYREKVARDRQQNLIKELEEEEKRMEAKEKRKQKKKLREKEKKRHIQQQKEEERRAKEERERTEKEQRRVAQQKRVEEQLNKKREEESRAKKAMEERNRRILEQADKRLAKEREERQRAEEQRLEREAREREERSRRQHPQVTPAPAPTPASVAALTATASPAPKPAADPLPVAISPPVLTKVLSAQLPAPSASASVATPIAARSPIALFAAGSASDHIFASSPGTPLLDNAMLPTINRPSPSFMASRPSLPMIHQPELPATSSEAFDFVPSRARANSGSSIRHPAPVPMPPFMSAARTSSSSPSAVPSEFDAEIMSIVGRVMGSCTLQDDLTDGAEWRTEPADSYLDSPRAMLPQPNHTAAFGLGDPLGPLSDLSVRRNSVPVNRAGREIGSGGLASFDINGSSKQSVSSTLTGGMEGVYSAYCALEKFSRDKRTPSAAGLGQDMFGGSHSAAEIAQMHGSMRESSVWGLCASYAQANPNKCRLNHAERSIALVRNLSGASPIVPAVLESQRLASPASPHFAETPRSTPPIQLPMIAEDRVGGNGLSQSQPHTQTSGSPSLAGLSARSQPRSPLMQSRQAAPGMASARPPMTLPMMPQFGQQPLQSQSQVGMNYSPVPHVSPSSLFFGPMATHGSGNMPIRGPAPPFSLPPFQQSPLGASSLGHAHLSDGRGMTMLPPPPSMSMSNSGQMFGPPSSFNHQLQMRPPSSPWPPTKLGGGDAVGELSQAAMRQPLMTRLGSPHAFSQQQQHQNQQQHQHHQFHHQHPLH